MTNNSNLKSICIVRLSALGDVLMLVPLIRTLQHHLPNTKLTWVISRPAYDLVEGLDGIEFIVIDKPNNIADYWRFKQRMHSYQFDVLLAVQSSFRANLLYGCIRAKRRIGYDSLRAKDGHTLFINERIKPGLDHTLDGFLRFADALGLPSHDIRWDLPIADADYAWARTQLPADKKGPYVIVNPAASKPERSWPTSRYIEVILYLTEYKNAQIILTGGPSSYDQCIGGEISKATPVINLIGKTKPKQLLALISLCDVVLCPDTGPSHMGAAVGTPVVALHAVTSANVSGPYCFRHLSVDYYPIAVETILKKTIETTDWGTHAHGMDTMLLIPVEDVIDKLNKVLVPFPLCGT